MKTPTKATTIWITLILLILITIPHSVNAIQSPEAKPTLRERLHENMGGIGTSIEANKNFIMVGYIITTIALYTYFYVVKR